MMSAKFHGKFAASIVGGKRPIPVGADNLSAGGQERRKSLSLQLNKEAREAINTFLAMVAVGFTDNHGTQVPPTMDFQGENKYKAALADKLVMVPAFMQKTGDTVPDHRVDRNAYKKYEQAVQPEYLERIKDFLNNKFFKNHLQPVLENMNARSITFEAAKNDLFGLHHDYQCDEYIEKHPIPPAVALAG